MTQKASASQYITLLEYMERHGDLSVRLASVAPHERLTHLAKWDELKAILDSDGSGVQKDVKKWQKLWSDWKYKVKTNAAIVRRNLAATGGGPDTSKELTPIELRLLGFLRSEALEGNGAPEPGVPQLEQHDGAFIGDFEVHELSPPPPPERGPEDNTVQEAPINNPQVVAGHPRQRERARRRPNSVNVRGRQEANAGAMLDIQQEYVELRRAIEERTAQEARMRLQVDLANANARQMEAQNVERLVAVIESLAPALKTFLEK